ncbi:MAG TPA: GNAT family N-acetyltransferase [Rubrobacter sp.]
MTEIHVRAASTEDVPLILSFINELAEYERLSDEVVATEDSLREWLFGERPVAEVVIGEHRGDAAGFALFFHNFSTFLGKPGIYLEDLYVRPEFRRAGMGRALLFHLARVARERGCGRLEWSVLDWNEPAIGFYRGIGASPVSGWTVYRVTGKALEKLGEH